MKKLVIVVLAASAAGCAGVTECETRTDYQGVEQTPPIRIPDAMEDLPSEVRLEIPTAATPPDVSGECLEKPPRYATGE
ncbi:MAG: hypothetical protein AAGL69_12425 [Pseudomonadota bacterium]